MPPKRLFCSACGLADSLENRVISGCPQNKQLTKCEKCVCGAFIRWIPSHPEISQKEATRLRVIKHRKKVKELSSTNPDKIIP